MALSSADSEGRAYRNASPSLRFFLAGACSLALMFLDHRGTYLEQVRAYLGSAMYPLQVAINSPAAGARWMRENMALRERLITENAALRREAAIKRLARREKLALVRTARGGKSERRTRSGFRNESRARTKMSRGRAPAPSPASKSCGA